MLADMGGTLLQILYDGGWMMWVIMLLFLFGFFVFAERSIVLGRVRLAARRSRRVLEQAMKNDRLTDFAGSRSAHPAGRVVAAGLEYVDGTAAQVEAALELEARRESRKFYRKLNWLGMIVVVAPLCGFLGTVTGLFFVGSSCFVASRVGAVSAGIAEALLTTAAGLFVAIPVQMALTMLRMWADRTEGEIEESVNRVLLHLAGAGR